MATPSTERYSGGPVQASRIRSVSLIALSFIPLLEQDADGAETILREGLATAQEAGDRVLIAGFRDSIAFLEVVRGNPKDAIPMRLSALEVYHQEGDVWKVANNLSGLAMISRMAGDLDAARGHLRQAFGMFIQASDTMIIAMVLRGLALVANDDGLQERAARLVGASARIRDELGGGIPPELIGRWGTRRKTQGRRWARTPATAPGRRATRWMRATRWIPRRLWRTPAPRAFACAHHPPPAGPLT